MLVFMRKAREAAKISQRNLSATLGREKNYVMAIETGSRRLDVIEFYEIARALGHPPADLARELMEYIEHRVSDHSQSHGDQPR